MNKSQKEILQSQLNSEKKTLNELKQVYTQALKDCETKIRELSSRTDMENLQSIIYQKQYQEALKGQLEGVLANLQSNSFATVSEYLTKCYQEGYTGVMYDLMNQGIPLIMPIDQEAVVKAIQTDSKISTSLYTKMGEDVKHLKNSIRAELSRGIANGSTWNEMAAKMAIGFKNTPFSKAYNNTIRIARTEGHRVSIQSAMDAQHKAKEKGADVVKQWDSTLDGKTRPTHRQLDGQIREIDDDFEVGGRKVKAPGMFGDPAEDCNCRCALLQRAKWALDEEELNTLKQRAEYFGLDKSKDFDDFKEKYLKIQYEQNYDDKIQKYLGLDSSKIKLDGMSDDVKSVLYDSLENVCEKIPMLKEQLIQFEFTGEESDAFAVSQSLTGILKFNSKCKNIDELKEAYLKECKLGFLVKGDERNVFIHELGHQLDGYLTKNKVAGAVINKYGVRRSSVEIMQETLEDAGWTIEKVKQMKEERKSWGWNNRDIMDSIALERREFISKNLSIYGATNENEFFAECFSEYMTSNNPGKIAKSFGKVLEKYIGEL